MQGNFGLKELTELLDTMQLRLLKRKLIEMNEVDITAFVEELDSEKTVVIYRMPSKKLASDVFACLPVEKQEHIIDSITDYEPNAIVSDLFVDGAMDMLEELPANVVKRVLRNSTPDTRELIDQFLKYPEGSAGSVMTAKYVGLRKHMTVEEVFAYIRRHDVDKETIYTCYIMDTKRTLEGVVTVRDLLMRPYEEVIGSIMGTHVIRAATVSGQEEVAESFRKYNLLSLPTVGHENHLVDVVTMNDVADIMEQEATGDSEKMAAILPSEKLYLKTGVFALAESRLAWLLILMVSGMITGSILTEYEVAFTVIPLLVTFIPMLTDTGGNADNQSSTMIIRGVTVGETGTRDVLQVLWKELRVGVIVGVLLGLVNYAQLVVRFPGQGIFCLTVVLSPLATTMLVKAIGCALPIVAQVLHLDLAIMATPLITTIVDAVSLIIYFQLACNLFRVQGMSRTGILLIYRILAFFN